MTDVSAVLEQAAKATEAAAEAKPKKSRVAKGLASESTTLGIDGEQVTKKTRAPRAPKLDAEGNPIVKAPKAKREPKEKVGRIALLVGGVATSLTAIQNEATIEVVGNLGSKEGSKRAERAKAFDGATTVQDFFAAGGASKDLLRHLKSGAIKLTVNGEAVSVVAAPAPVAKEEAAAETGSDDAQAE